MLTLLSEAQLNEKVSLELLEELKEIKNNYELLYRDKI